MTKKAAVLLPSQLRHLIRVTEAASRHPERDVLILWLGFSCGMRVTETARLPVAGCANCSLWCYDAKYLSQQLDRTKWKLSRWP